MTIEAWGDRLAPDIPETLRRFPLPVALAAAATLCILSLTNEVVQAGDETWIRLALGFASAAIYAVAGVFFSESRRQDRVLGLVLAYAVPALVFVLLQVRDSTYIVPYVLPIIGALWLSVAAFTLNWRGAGTAGDAQHRFWWLNHRALASAAIAGVALGLIALGIIAIERTLSSLFGLEATGFFYRTVLPILGFFFAPLYWLSTLPRLEDYDPRVLEHPDFLARAVGLVGKFVLIPLLLAYSAILLAYTGQIVLTLSLPQGVLGWMVMGFVLAGAATWLVLHPPFMHESGIVRFFRRTWFWLTLLPLVLFAVALYVRVDSYGFTPERLILFWGGVWAALLALIFLLGRGDIRMIPGLAAVCLLVASVGPWNLENLPRVQQALTLDGLLARSGPGGTSIPAQPDWTAEEQARAVGAITYLAGEDSGRRELARVLRGHGIEANAAGVDARTAMMALGIEPDAGDATHGFSLARDFTKPVDVSATPWLISDLFLHPYESSFEATGLKFRIDGRTLLVSRGGAVVATVDLAPLIEGNSGSTLPLSAVSFAVETRRYVLVADLVTVRGNPGESVIDYVDGTLFSASPAD